MTATTASDETLHPNSQTMHPKLLPNSLFVENSIAWMIIVALCTMHMMLLHASDAVLFQVC